ncbi:hypothetical protein B0J13DRAFT_617118 [Dactylonectria estremocensis]|uniref:Uncharacterized protein n=1 Tax=Dactylonectria estremocensis TaxID=1079267 RepID=A0A9P9JIN7_9HYPO|nr:hypothetical protein B0J13DRAFT_617118 [Dactylonectria estremocensis]
MESATIVIVVIGVLFILGLMVALTSKIFAANEGQAARRARAHRWRQTRGEQQDWTPPSEHRWMPAARQQERPLPDDVELNFRDSATTLQKPPRAVLTASGGRRPGSC